MILCYGAKDMNQGFLLLIIFDFCPFFPMCILIQPDQSSIVVIIIIINKRFIPLGHRMIANGA